MTSTSILYSACVGSVVTTLSCTPFDVVKNYWQGSPYLNHKRSSVSAISVVKEIYRKFGIRGFWRGTAVSLSYVVPNNLTYFSIYETQKKRYYPFVAAAQARTVSVLLFSPIEFMRTKVQACIGQPESATAIAVVRKVLNEEQFISLWRGAGATLMRDVPFSMVYFSLYESNKQWLSGRRLGALGGPSQQPSTGFTFGTSLVNGAFCGAVATVLTHPFDVVKTQLQSYERVKAVNNVKVTTVYSLFRAWEALYREYGLRGLFSIGLTPRLAKVMPASAIMLSTYELVHSTLTA